MKANPKVSIVIPVYNTEPWLRECLDSVVNQTLQEIEVICIDDGSTDGSFGILCEYASKDPRVTVICQENRGLSATRNRGMDQARGEYVYFLDSDDYINLDAMETLYEISVAKELDILLFGAKNIYETEELRNLFSQREKVYARKMFSDKTISGVEMLRLMLEEQYTPVVWAYFIRRYFLLKSGMRFYEGIIHEDELFTPLLLVRADRALSIEQLLYHRRFREGSIMTNSVALQRFDSLFIIACELLTEAERASEINPQKSRLLWEIGKRLFERDDKVYISLSDEQRANVLKEKPLKYQRMHQLFLSSKVAYYKYQKELQTVRNQYQEKIKTEKNQVDSWKKKADAFDRELITAHAALKEMSSETELWKRKAIASKGELSAVHASWTYRIGRFMTWLPRKTRGCIRCFKENGLAYTLHRFVAHIVGNK